MFWYVLCILLTLQVASGYIADDMTEIIQLCCNEGTGFARNYTGQECSSSHTVPSEVPQTFASLCIIAKAQCCKEHYQKKRSCDTGIDIATSSQHCDLTKDLSKVCCDQCMSGTEAGLAKGAEACTSAGNEDQLANDAFVQCCKKAVREKREKDKNSSPKTAYTFSRNSDPLASVCEDYAPNELCAHHCIPVPGSYKCECNPGFMLMADGRNCREVLKNRCKPRNPCQHKCNDNGIEVKCSCRRGYELMPDGKSCQDIDECQLDIPVCLPNTQCHNRQGSYRCLPIKKEVRLEKEKCPPGYARNVNHNVCDDVNECLLPTPPCPSYLCENTMGGYKCGGVSGDPSNLEDIPKTSVEDKCPTGFQLGTNEECEDVDECALQKDDCNKISQFCINTHSSFYCQDQASKHCPPGFKIESTSNKCQDIDECEDDEVCQEDEICVNQLGQYDCRPKVSCPDGMRLKPGSAACQDIDECVEGTHLCDLYQQCLNTNGSYECHCKSGYELDITTGACVDMNECATGQHECISGSQRCDNTVGSYLCIRITSCGTGYILHHSTGTCEDVDECAIGTHNCARAGPEYQCINIPGSFRCVRRRVSSTSSTSTTPEPEYDYVWEYDSEEETDPNNTTSTVSKPVETSSSTTSTTTTTLKPEPETEPVPETFTETKPAETTSTSTTSLPLSKPNNDFNRIDSTPVIDTERQFEPDPSIPKFSTDISYSEPKYDSDSSDTYFTIPDEPVTLPNVIKETTPQITFIEPEQPEITYISKPEEPERRIPEADITTPPPEVNYNTYKSIESNELGPEKPAAIDRDSVEKPTYQEPDISNSIDTLPETTYSPVPEKTSPSYQGVIVNVGNTVTVPPQRTDDSSIGIKPKDVPNNRGRKIYIKPRPCPHGFEVDEYGACFDIDECSTNRHSCSGLTEVCRNTMGGYLCDCAPGFRRDLVTGACDFVTTSSSTTTSTTTSTTPMPPSSSERGRSFFWGYPDYRPPISRPFRPRNMCDAGYHLNSKTGKCEDINECTNGQANCAVVEICVNTEGGYRCECPPNWKLDDVRHRCVPIRSSGRMPPGYGNEPTKTPPYTKAMVDHGAAGTKFVNPEVTQVYQGSVFKCRWGYRLVDDNTCEDIDECATGEAKCGPIQICNNLPGGYSCSCPQGYKLAGDHMCNDIDECNLAAGSPLCSQNADCINTIGSYKCNCHKGFVSAPVNDKVCVDVDECVESRSGSLCQQRCNNVWGGYRCSCHRGYRLSPDNSTCSDIDECQEFKSNLPCVGRCLNEPGSYRCSCPSGYRLSEDKRSCIDIDECETGEATCAKGGMYGGSSHICFNTRGSYRCHQIRCPPGYLLEGKHRCTKMERVCKPGDWECAHQPTTISHNFITFVSNLYIPDSKVKLFTMRGPAWPNARMRFQLRLVDVNAPPNVKDKADINYFLLLQHNNEAVMSLVRPLEGPQSIELELSMELHSGDQFGGIAVAKLFIFVSEYEF